MNDPGVDLTHSNPEAYAIARLGGGFWNDHFSRFGVSAYRYQKLPDSKTKS